MLIQWYPGHMNKARRLVEISAKKADLILELRDARIPVSSMNPLFSEMFKNKPRLIILNKSDLADPAVSSLWLKSFEKKDNTWAMCLCSKNRNAGKLLASKINEIKKQYSFNVRHEVLRGLVAGVPNVGKSTLINQLGGGKKQNAENKPGVTRDVKIIPVSDNFEILDSPGLLWPKIEDQNNAVKLALLGCIKDEILDAPELAAKSLLIFLSKYPVLYEKRYGIKIEIPHDTEEAVDYVHSIIDSTAKKRGCILQGGITDIEKASKLIIKEIREGVLGCISLESPEDLEKILD